MMVDYHFRQWLEEQEYFPLIQGLMLLETWPQTWGTPSGIKKVKDIIRK
jgi:hypothetical protein